MGVSAKLISVIGPPAVGKTTLAEWFAGVLPAAFIREDYAGNPFLADSYTGDRQACLPAQLYYLMSRVSQLSRTAWPTDGAVVSDYGFCQDRIYAAAKLDADELALYDQLAGRLDGLVVAPSVVVHLDASVATLQARIAARGRQFERAMDEAFLSQIRRSYDNIDGELGCPVIRVDCEVVDLLSPADRRGVLEQVKSVLGKL